MRIEIVTLEGRTRFLELGAGATRVSELRAGVAALMRIPAPLLRLKCGTRDLHDAAALDAAQLAAMPVRVALRLTGGKGGFGAMLRTAGAKNIKTTNFDACRDLNGRRLKHVNAEQQLREWEAGAAERERKKQEKVMRNPVKGPTPPSRFDDDAHDEMLEATRRSVAEAVAASGAAAALSRGGSSSEAESSGGSSPSNGASAEGAAGGGNGKRSAAAADGERPAKAGKLSAAMDPLAGLMGDGEEGSSSEEEEEATA